MLEHERCLYDCLIRTFRVVSGGRRILAVLELLAGLIDVLKLPSTSGVTPSPIFALARYRPALFGKSQ